MDVVLITAFIVSALTGVALIFDNLYLRRRARRTAAAPARVPSASA
ncbi:hypothetical protein [Burkholderia anthina]|nr:hypothetical protein [Burkholderia anthina]